MTKSSYGVALRALNARGGVIPASLFHTYSGSPNKRLKGHVGSDRILDDLIHVGLVGKADLAGVDKVIYARGMGDTFNEAVNLMRARLKAEQIVLHGLKDWLRKLGLVSYEAVQIRGDQERNHFGQFEWDLTAPSYIYPLTSFSRKEKKLLNGFFVADVICMDDLRTADVQYFVNKFEIMKNGRNTRPFMAMLVATRFEKESFRETKQKGFLVTSVESIFGKDTADALRTLVRILSDAAAAVATQPEKLDTLIGTLSKIEGASLNVRSDLFEVIVGYCMKEAEGGYVDLRLIVEDPKEGGQAEIDVLSMKRESVTIIECKGIQGSKVVTQSEVEEWLTKKVPRIRNFLLSKYTDRHLEFAMWTTGGFEEEALDYLKERKTATKKYGISWKDRPAIMEFLSKKKLRQIKDMIEHHY